MPRLVKKTATSPVKVGDKHVCMCGLSQNEPYCDGSHHHTKGEEKHKLYFYQGDNREEVATEDEKCPDCNGHCCGEE